MDLTHGLTQPNPDKKYPDPTQPKSEKVDPCPALRSPFIGLFFQLTKKVHTVAGESEVERDKRGFENCRINLKYKDFLQVNTPRTDFPYREDIE